MLLQLWQPSRSELGRHLREDLIADSLNMVSQLGLSTTRDRLDRPR